MKKLMVYSHDTFGLGNIRRVLAICTHLIDAIPDLSILIVSGSPMIHSFRIPQRLDYIKLPCLSRTAREGYSVKYLSADMADMMRLRSNLILTAVADFTPDLLLVDKKPYGVENELKRSLAFVKRHLPATRTALLLRDILDSPEVTRQVWEKKGYYEAIESFYDLVLVLGMPEIFDPRAEYRFPASVSEKVRFCGHIQKMSGQGSREAFRRELQLDKEKMILVTPGGGEDGSHLLETYVAGLQWLPDGHHTKSLIICGPEMPEPQRKGLSHATRRYPHVRVSEFTDDLVSYMDAADLVISMGGYNTVCEILSLKKRAIVVPRVRPVGEQWIRAERMARLGLFKVIHPDLLTPHGLIRTVLDELTREEDHSPPSFQLDLCALPRITTWISTLLHDTLGRLDPDPLCRKETNGAPSSSAVFSSKRPHDSERSFLVR